MACMPSSSEGLHEVRQVMPNSVAMVGYRMPQMQALNAQQSNQQHGIRLKVSHCSYNTWRSNSVL